MTEHFPTRTSSEVVSHQLKQDYGADQVELICESIPIADRHIRIFKVDGISTVVQYDACDGEGSTIYSNEDIRILGCGDETSGLDKLISYYSSAEVDPKFGISTLKE